MPVKRETLKFTRIQARPSYLSNDEQERPVRGYLNLYKDFHDRWDTEIAQGFTGMSTTTHPEYYYSYQQPPMPVAEIRKSIAPFEFFSDLGPGAYKELAFTIDGLFEPYDRRVHDLSNWESRVYILQPDGSMRLKSGENVAPRMYYNTVDENLDSFTFRVNPTNIQVRKKKLFRKLRTRAGWVFQHWGPEIGIIQIRGTTGSVLPDPAIKFALKNVPVIGDIPIISTLEDEKPTVQNSPAFRVFRELEKWYDEDQSEEAGEKGFLTALEYRDRTYVGHIQDFMFEERGERPFQFYYSITFLVHYDSGRLQDAVTRANSQVVRNERTLMTIRKLQEATNG